MSEILVSVVIPSCGRELNIVDRAVQSVLHQEHQPVEVILADDNAAGDERCEALESYCNSFENVHYVRTSGRQGACFARNLGFEKSKGAYVGFLDDDDEWLPRKITVSLPLFTEGVGMVGTRGYQVIVSDAGETVEPYMKSKWKARPSFLDLLRYDSVGTTTLCLIERQCFIDCGGFAVSLPARQDYELWLRISKKYQIVLSEEFQFRHYQHAGEQISKNHQRALDGLKYIYDEFYEDYQKDKRAYGFYWIMMLKRYRGLGDKKMERKCLMRVLKVQPRYLGRYIAQTTKNPKLSAFLMRHMRNE